MSPPVPEIGPVNCKFSSSYTQQTTFLLRMCDFDQVLAGLVTHQGLHNVMESLTDHQTHTSSGESTGETEFDTTQRYKKQKTLALYGYIHWQLHVLHQVIMRVDSTGTITRRMDMFTCAVEELKGER